MSVITITTRLLTVKPRARLKGDVLRVRTSIPQQLLCLLSYGWPLRVDRRQKTFDLRVRFLWLFLHARAIQF